HPFTGEPLQRILPRLGDPAENENAVLECLTALLDEQADPRIGHVAAADQQVCNFRLGVAGRQAAEQNVSYQRKGHPAVFTDPHFPGKIRMTKHRSANDVAWTEKKAFGLSMGG